MARTVVVGSAEWCEYWAQFYWNQACKFSRDKYPLDAIQSMYCMFMSYYWEDTEPWHA